ncbi:hypothetical protein PV396_44580 [Streptomyces sp. ME02-8801-2C]|uniref:hypothetical protein n=1 Tax=Streptomyces sp. ME02-8801-2C TaxID=3028680 RepID=UPI0029AF1EAF|nr:hypothetical protein [Streptomyces sp. ME02-8801-2C]MDX3458922.1 hypothetical protein [Streptomyces sp. ME02-8801-2C]
MAPSSHPPTRYRRDQPTSTNTDDEAEMVSGPAPRDAASSCSDFDVVPLADFDFDLGFGASSGRAGHP